jgi:hypothetical protein
MFGVPFEVLVVVLLLVGAFGVAAGLFAYLGKISGSNAQAIKLTGGIGLGALIAPLPLILAIASAVAGHGHYEFARLFFPAPCC